MPAETLACLSPFSPAAVVAQLSLWAVRLPEVAQRSRRRGRSLGAGPFRTTDGLTAQRVKVRARRRDPRRRQLPPAVANPEAMEGFDEQVSAWIRAAAQDAASWALEHARDREAAEMADACAGGARFVVATESQIDALRARVQPVYDRLQSDPSTAEIFSRVQQLADAAPPDEPAAIPPGCQFVPGDEELAPDVPAQLAAPGDPGDLPQGVYRYELTEEYLRAVGLTEGDVYQNAGIFTYTLTDGRWSYEQEALNDNLASTSCEGFYDVQGQLFIGSVSTVQTVGECAPPLWTATWSFEDGTLRWSGLEGDFAPIYAGEDGWLKIA